MQELMGRILCHMDMQAQGHKLSFSLKNENTTHKYSGIPGILEFVGAANIQCTLLFALLLTRFCY